MSVRASVTVDPERLRKALVAAAEVNSHQVVLELDTTGDEPECVLSATDGASVMYVETSLVITGDYTEGVDLRVAIDLTESVTDSDWFREPAYKKVLGMLDYHGDAWTIAAIDADDSEQYGVDAVRFSEDGGWAFAFEQHQWLPAETDPSKLSFTQTIEGASHTARGALFGISKTAERAPGHAPEIAIRTFTDTDRAVVEAVNDGANPPTMRLGSRTDESASEPLGKRFAADFVESVALAAPECGEWVFRCAPDMPLVVETGASTWAIAPRLETNNGGDEQ